MSIYRQYGRICRVVYGDPNAGIGPDFPFDFTTSGSNRGLRVQFDIQRSNRARPDDGILRIYNLPRDIREGMWSDLEYFNEQRAEIQRQERDFATRARRLATLALAYRVTIYAGYEGAVEQVFTGDITALRPSIRQTPDIVTEIKIGDWGLAIRDGFINKTFAGPSIRLDNILAAAEASMAVERSESGRRFIDFVAPNSRVEKGKNGYYTVGRPEDVINQALENEGVQWFVREGVMYYVGQETLSDDFSIVLDTRKNLIQVNTRTEYGDISWRTLLSPSLLPGRGVVIVDDDGKRTDQLGYRLDTVRMVADTHGQPWYSVFTGTSSGAVKVEQSVNLTEADILETFG